MIASSDANYSTDRLLSLMTSQMRGYISKFLMTVREEYLVANKDYSITSSTPSIRVPERAIGNKIKNVLLVDGTATVPLPRIEPERRHEFVTSGAAGGYMFEDSNIVFVPAPTGSFTVRVVYFQRRSRLVQATECGLITAINTGAKQVTISAVPTLFTGALTLDFVRATPPFDNLSIDQPATIAGSVITFTNALPTGLAVGDYVAFANQSPIPQIPIEMHELLVERAVLRILESLGDPKAAVTKALLDEDRNDSLGLITPRAEGNARIIRNPYAPGFSGRGGRRWW